MEIFSLISKLSAIFEQAELQGAQKWALIMVLLMQKERLKSPQKSLIIANQAFL